MPKWKPVALDGGGIFNNLEGLIGIEVLEEDDTEVICGKGAPSKKTKSKENPSRQTKKLKRKSDEDGNEIPAKKLKAKGNKSKTIIQNNELVDKASGKLKSTMQKTSKCKIAAKEHLEDKNGNKVDYEDNLFMDEMEAWRKHGIRREILKALHDKGFYTPTKIQQNCVHAAMTSKKSDIVGAAETGSGKTFAYGIPLVQDIIIHKETTKCPEGGTLAAVVLTPTRELAVQVKEQLVHLCKYTDINVAMVVGGLAKEKQERLLKRKPEIVVGTPGRLWELFNDGNPHLINLPLVRMLVVDEADRMLEQKHFAELGELLEKMNADPEVSEGRRNFVFSATLTFVHDPPSYHQGKKKQPKQKLGELLGKIGVKNQIVYDLSAEKLTPASLSEWKVQCRFEEKDYYLVHFLQQNPGRAIIFCNSIGCVKRLANLLNILKLKPLPLHANMEQKQRLRNLEKFRDNKEGLLLATDVAARGLDIPNVGHVVHYQVPRTAESYVHRSGRAARQSQAGATLLLVTVEETRQYNKLMKSLKREHGVDDLDISIEELDQVKKIVHLARDIDQAGLALRRTTSNEKWYAKAAEEMDIILDDDIVPKKTSDHALKKLKKDLNFKEKQLCQLLATPTLPRGFSGKFPDMNLLKPAKMRRKLS